MSDRKTENTCLINETIYDLQILKEGKVIKIVTPKSAGVYQDIRGIAFKIGECEVKYPEHLTDYSTDLDTNQVVIERNAETNTIIFHQLFGYKTVTLVNSTDETLTAISRARDGLLNKAEIVNHIIPPKSCAIISRLYYLYNSQGTLIFAGIKSPAAETKNYCFVHRVGCYVDSKLIVTKK